MGKTARKISTNPGVRLAAKIAGGQVPLARKLGRSQSCISDWVRGALVPVDAAVTMEALTGIPAEQVCAPLVQYAILRGIPVRELPQSEAA